MSVADEEMDPTVGGEKDTTNAAPPPSAKSLKNFGSKKGPKLARSRGKQSVTLNTKASKSGPKKPSVAK